jgi:uncharacterized protein with GYD domain
MNGLVLVKTSIEAVDEAIKEAKKIEGVVDAYAVFGRFDMVVLLGAKDFPSLMRTVVSVSSLKGVRSTETLIEGD